MANIFNEAFSSSMPDWMREVIKNGNQLYNIKEYLISNNVNPDTAVFHEVPVPTSARQFDLKNDDTKIVFYDLVLRDPRYYKDRVNHSIFILGTNDDDDFYNPATDEYLKLKTASWAKIFQSCLHVCYVDKLESGSLGAQDKQRTRKINNQLPREIHNKSKEIKSGSASRYGWDIDDMYDEMSPNRMKDFSTTRVPELVQQEIKKNRYGKKYDFDKSGYIKDPNLLNRLKKKYPGIAFNNTQKRLQSYYDKLVGYKLSISDAILSSNLISTNEEEFDIVRAFDAYTNALNYYNQAYEYVQRGLQNEEGAGYADYLASHASKNLTECNKQMNILDKMIKGSESYEVDWDSDDMYISEED